MPNKTIYVQESDLALWDRAQSELGDSVSAILTDCLRRKLEEASRQPQAAGLERITLEIWEPDGSPLLKKSFFGRWLVSGALANHDDSGIQWDLWVHYAVVQSQKGRIVVYQVNESTQSMRMEVHEDFEAMKLARSDSGCPKYPMNIVALTAEALAQDYEIELDI